MFAAFRVLLDVWEDAYRFGARSYGWVDRGRVVGLLGGAKRPLEV